MLGDRINQYETAVLCKAAALSGAVQEVTIGPGRGSGPMVEEPRVPTSQSRSSPDRVMGFRPAGSSAVSEEDQQYSNMYLQKLLCDMELQRKQHVKAVVKERVERVLELERCQREFMELRLDMLRGKGEARRLEDQQAILRQIEEEEASTRESQARIREQNQQRINERNQKIREAEQKKRDAEEKERKRIKEKKERLDELHQHQCKYGNTYQLILEAAKKCRDKQALATKLSGHMSKLRSLNEAMEQLVRHCQTSDVSAGDVKTAVELLQQITAIQQFIQGEADKINAKEEEADKKKELAEQEKRAKSVENNKPVKQPEQVTAAAAPAAAAPAAAAPAAAAPATAAKNQSATTRGPELSPAEELSQFVSPESLQMYQSLRQFLQDFQRSYTELLKSDALKKFRFECQRAVNVPLNSISDVSSRHLEDKYVKLSCLLSGRPVEIADVTIVPSRHQQGVPFCQNLMAEKLVHLAELTAVQPKTVFPLAAIVVALWVDSPDFGRLLLAHLYSKCPYLVPMFPPQLENQTDMEYYKSLGYNYSDNKEVESQESFLKRMSGIMKLFAAVVVTPVRRRQGGVPHPHSLRAAWRWLASFLNLAPHPDICATLLYEFLEVAGSVMYAAYGRQFQKLLHYICKEYLPKIQKISPSSSSGPRVRLETFLQKVLVQGKIPPPDGTLPPNFW